MANALVLIITAVSGLITAITGLYGQILTARKLRLELELARQQSKAEERVTKKKGKTQTTKRKTAQKIDRKK